MQKRHDGRNFCIFAVVWFAVVWSMVHSRSNAVVLIETAEKIASSKQLAVKGSRLVTVKVAVMKCSHGTWNTTSPTFTTLPDGWTDEIKWKTSWIWRGHCLYGGCTEVQPYMGHGHDKDTTSGPASQSGGLP